MSGHDSSFGERIATRFGACVQELRLSLGLSCADVAERVYGERDYHPLVCRVESGLHAPNVRTVNVYAAALGVPAGRLLYWIDEVTP